MSRKASVWILGDQLLRRHPVLAEVEAEFGRENVFVVLVESQHRLRKRPYQRKKLVLLLAAMRNYAKDLRRQGYHVDEMKAPTFAQALRRHVKQRGTSQLFTMAAADYEGRRFQQERLKGLLGIPVIVRPNAQFLGGEFDPYPDPEPGKRYLMEHFYRKMRRHFDVLMVGDEPAGGKWNYDRENRKPLPKGIQPTPLIAFEPDEMTRRVMHAVTSIGTAIGNVNGFDLAVTRQQALAALDDFVASRLPEFGPYEDAMSSEHSHLFHSKLSAYLNIGLLEPMELIRAAEDAYVSGAAPINSAEGFIRQILGWREYIYWQYWRLMPDLYESNYWGAERPLPGFFWDGRTEMNCLRHVIDRALEDGYTHHIERLMVICNFCLLAGIEPQAANDWFLSSYIDAYDWVMGPNVLGMGLNADGGLIATKPYIASANYVNKMSDYCQGCRFDHKQRIGENACPFNFLYWNFLIEHEELLRANPRLGPNVLGLRHLDEGERTAVQREADGFLSLLGAS
jgi:deoxyribodipyrimidine photolyase-related protein